MSPSAPEGVGGFFCSSRHVRRVITCGLPSKMVDAQRGPMPPIAAVALRLAFYVVLGWVGLAIFPPLLSLFGVLIGAAIGVFAAAAVANAITVRIFERGTLVD